MSPAGGMSSGRGSAYDLDRLNEPQRAAVRHLDGPLLVLAGAGSGKTRVITHKIAYLVRECGYAPRNVWAVTFTNKAAREMAERVGQLLAGRDSRGLHISTFHTLGLEILKREHAELGLRGGFTLLDAQDQLELIRALAEKEGGGNAVEADALRHRISLWKNDFLLPNAAESQSEDEEQLFAARVYARYQRQLQACNAVDFDDLIMRPVELLRDNAKVRERWQNRVRHLLVDEYQDTNTAQYELVRQLIGIEARLTAVGDDHQSVYAWRGARPENLGRLKDDLPRLTLIKLEQNYRSVNSVLKAANHLISHNRARFEKNLWSALGPGEPLRVIACATPEEEAGRIASEIIHHRFRERTRYSDYAVLFRGNHQARLIEEALRQLNIPYTLSGGQSFFERAEIKDVMAYLRLLANPDDDTAFLRVVNTPRREIGPGTLEKLGDHAHERGVSLLRAASEFALASRLSERAHQRLTRFADWIAAQGRRADQDGAAPDELLRGLLREVGYESWLSESSPNAKAAQRRWKNVEDWLDWLGRLREQGYSRLSEMASRMSLMGILERQEDEQERDAVALMTLHAAKGLEFPHVFIVGLEEELLPHRESSDPERLEEERRLFYVGITRARQTLTLTLAKRRRRYGETVLCEPSRFLEELPAELLRREGFDSTVDPEESRQRGRASLEGLKAFLQDKTGDAKAPGKA